MKRTLALLLVPLAVAAAVPYIASAQTNPQLTPAQARGRIILTQNCNICHLPQNPGSQTYGPLLNKDSANGDDNLMKQVIQTGLVKMPGWRYTLNDTQINDVIAYIRTLPVVAPPPPPAKGAGKGAEKGGGAE
jgi:mono/diheme cytochrome c family protein